MVDIGLSGLIHVNHLFSVDIAERQAAPFAVPDAGEPVTSIALSLTPRRLRDYANPKLEWFLALACIHPLCCLNPSGKRYAVIESVSRHLRNRVQA